MAGEKDKSKVPDRASRSGSISSSKKTTRGKSTGKEPKVEIDPELLLSARKKKDSGEEDAKEEKKPSTSKASQKTDDKKKTTAASDKEKDVEKKDEEDKKEDKKEDHSARRRAERKKALAERKKALADKKKSSSSRSSSRSSKSSSSSSRSDSRSPRTSTSSIPGESEGSMLTQRYLKIPVWGWIIVALVGFGVTMVVMDLRNQDRYLMVCTKSTMEIHAGKRLPWPFGHERVGGSAFRPVKIPRGGDCRPQVFVSRYDAQRGLLDHLLIQIHAALSRPGVNDLGEARQQAQQALELSTSLRKLAGEVNTLRAELAYRQGRNGIARVEDELRTALNRFREARKLDKKRFKDMGEWIDHLQGLLVSVSPSPRKGPRLPAPPSLADIKPEKPPRKPDAGVKKKKSPPSPDASQPEEATGTLM